MRVVHLPPGLSTSVSQSLCVVIVWTSKENDVWGSMGRGYRTVDVVFRRAWVETDGGVRIDSDVLLFVDLGLRLTSEDRVVGPTSQGDGGGRVVEKSRNKIRG